VGFLGLSFDMTCLRPFNILPRLVVLVVGVTLLLLVGSGALTNLMMIAIPRLVLG